MTISSSLNAGVAGLNANATRLATIADNIANSATYGYKRSSADFHSMVIESGGYNRFSAGGVRVSSMRLIDERGPLVSSSNPTDIAIDGRGFLPVTTLAALDGQGTDYPLALTTTGSFRPDADGILRTETGLVLMGWPAQPNGAIPTFPRDTTAGLEPVRINTNQFVGNPTTLLTMGVNLPATATMAGASGDTIDMSLEYYGNLGTSEKLDVSFTPSVPGAGAGASNEWVMVIRDSASGGAVVGEYRLSFDDSQTAGGTLAGVTTLSGGAYDPATGQIGLTVGGGALQLDIGIPGQQSAMTQLSSSFVPGSPTKNGSPVANLSSVEIDANGFLHAVYDQGFTRRIYQIPLVDVPNPNGLISLNNQTYQISPASGSYFLWDAGDGPTGAMVGFAREESATDVAAELTNLIQTQRAYSSNAKVIQTVDEMLQETTNIKR
ncbi:flagellar hook protein FlgE [Ruixingdingia sedimenti]|uniref:Flagellar hook protein FlgE n=1 Tax=Ruixingdingia sedimenti TaxID=3073604 RepID=A0ABU1F789_9RHOB|nr:flagellar hook-basal body complex protein [Xinfangfangia sp. LG-4]MDR5652732.1 flagellar hook-basal body complex protein [Xinfangfangia sp. LG-4]